MTRRTKKMLSLLLATAMVFTMNTAAFAKETKGEVELADATLADAQLQSETQSETNGAFDGDETIDEVTDILLDNINKDYSGDHLLDPENFKPQVGTDGSVVLKNVDSPISWNNYRVKAAKTADADTAAVDLSKAIIPGYEGGALIETVLSGYTVADQYLINADKLGVSDNNGVYGLVPGYREYDVVPLDDNYFLFVGYGGDYNHYFVSDALDRPTPVFVFDGRKIAYNKSGLGKSNKGSAERLNVDIALVKYENNTVTKVPGVTVAKVKVAKDNKNATVSGQFVTELNVDSPKLVFNTISEKQPSFTITAKIDGKQAEAKAQKKAITKALKDDDCKYTFDISQRVVDINTGDSKGINNPAPSFFENDLVKKDSNGVLSANAVEAVEKYNEEVWRDGVDDTAQSFDGFTLSKLNVDKNKGSLVLNVRTNNGKKVDTAAIKLKAGAKGDYTLEEGSLAGTKVSVLNFNDKGNFIYSDARDAATDLASAGYKYCFRATPSTDKKDKKKFRIGFYRDTNDGFCYGVE